MKLYGIIICILGVFINYIIGCIVLAWVDRDEKIYNWAKNAPNTFLFFIVVELWWVIMTQLIYNKYKE